MTLSLRWKFLLPLLLATGVLVFAMERFWLQRSLVQVEATQAESLRNHLDSVADGLLPLVMGNQLDVIKENLDSLLAKNQDWLSLTLVDARGRQLYPPRLAGAARQSAVNSDVHSVVLDLGFEGRPLARLEARYDMKPHMDRQRREYRSMSLLLMTILAAGMAMLWLVVERVVYRPLRQLAGAAGELARHNFDAALPPAGGDEIGDLMRGFERMRRELRDHHAELVREIEERRQIQAELTKYQTRLEHMVQERTAALREAELMYRTVADYNYDWETWIGPDGCYIYCSPSCLRVTGYSAEDFLAHPDRLFEITHPDDREAVREHFREYGRVAHLEEFSFRIRRRDGSERWIEHGCQPVFDASGGLIGRRASNRDITERKKVEASLAEARDAAEAASRAKSVFLANMSHELRTPMNAILGMTFMALRRSEGTALHDMLGKIEQGARRLLGIVNDILDIAKIEADRMVLQEAGFGLAEVFDDLDRLVGRQAAEKGLAFTVDRAGPSTGLRLVGDSVRLGQVLVNLAGNAVKFTQQGGVTVRAGILEETGERVVLRFEVADTGIGIPAEEQGRLFVPFEQLDGSTTRKYGGTGLGLAISKRLVEMMGGRIGVESVPGCGSTFWFTLGLAKAAPHPATDGRAGASASPEAWIRAEHPGAHVLLVEDEPINREVSQGMLEDVGLRVSLAADGAEAVAKAAGERYDLILMDVHLPGLNGIEAARAIRAGPHNAATPILALTASAFDTDRQACLEAGMDDHLGKPVDPDRLYAALLHWLPGRVADSPVCPDPPI